MTKSEAQEYIELGYEHVHHVQLLANKQQLIEPRTIAHKVQSYLQWTNIIYFIKYYHRYVVDMLHLHIRHVCLAIWRKLTNILTKQDYFLVLFMILQIQMPVHPRHST